MPGAPACLRPASCTKLGAAFVWQRRVTRIEFHAAQIVLVSRLHMYQLAKQILTDHIQYRHDVAPITNIFEQHVWRAGSQLRSQHRPMIVQRDARDHLATDCHLCLHRRNRHFCVPIPRRDDQHGIERCLGEHRFPGIGTAGKHLRLFVTSFVAELERGIQHQGLDIA